jgi:Zn-dependent oligopeptidase
MEFKNILLDLEILKLLKEGEKLAIDLHPGYKKLYITTNTYLSSIIRKYNGYDRTSTVEYLEELNEKINKTSLFFINGNHNEDANVLYKALKDSINGIQNLKNTYINDSNIYAKLNLLIKSFNNIMLSLKSIDVTLNELEVLEQ